MRVLSSFAGSSKWAVGLRVVVLALGCQLFLAGFLAARTQETDPQFSALLRAGEFPAALQMADATSDPATARAMYRQIGAAQGQFGGVPSGGLAAMPELPGFGGANVGDGNGGPGNAGLGGGITLGDFQPLMNLIEQTIASESWVNAGNGDGTMTPFLAGVSIDAEGKLKRIGVRKEDRWAGLLGEQPRKVGERSPSESLRSGLRLLSLVELERTVAGCLERGQAVPAEVFYLGGLYDLESVVIQPESGDLLISGPAGPWEIGSDGVAVNTSTGRPLLRLDDLVTCLRASVATGGRFGCSITPRKKNLAAMQEFLATTRLSGAAWRNQLQATVGAQDVEVFGIAPDSHAARTLVVADHHMKLLGMGLEPGPVGLLSLFDETVSNFNGTPIPVDVARWWFTLGDFSVVADTGGKVYSVEGPVVRVLSETEWIDARGERVHTGKSLGPTARFARDFTDRFDEIAARYPIYHQLAGVFKLAVVCGLIRQEALDRQVGWDHGCFAGLRQAERAGDHSDGELLYSGPRYPVARTVDSVMNWKELETRSAGKRYRHTIAGVSGGVECDVRSSLGSVRIGTKDLPSARLVTQPIRPEGVIPTGQPDLWRDLR